jgi:hypothetical protein
MKRLIVVLLFASFARAQTANQTPGAPPPPAPPAQQTPAPAPEIPPANPADVKSLDAIIRAVYDVISGPVGQKRDWNRFRSLFIPGARLIPAGPKREGAGYAARVLNVEEYVARVQNPFNQHGFYETEAARTVEQWGNIAQVFSTYESRHAPGDQPFQRGINSFQLLNDGQRWWVVTIYWQGETKDVPIPPEFLKSPK